MRTSIAKQLTLLVNETTAYHKRLILKNYNSNSREKLIDKTCQSN